MRCLCSFTRLLVSFLSLTALTGCGAGQSLQTTYEQPAPAAAAPRGSAVLVAVTDDRPYVKNGDKLPYHLGKYRAGLDPLDPPTSLNPPPRPRPTPASTSIKP